MNDSAIPISAMYRNQSGLEREILFTIPQPSTLSKDNVLSHLTEIGQIDIVTLLRFVVLESNSSTQDYPG